MIDGRVLLVIGRSGRWAVTSELRTTAVVAGGEGVWAIFIYVRLNKHVQGYVTRLQEEGPLCCHGDRQNERQWRAGGGGFSSRTPHF